MRPDYRSLWVLCLVRRAREGRCAIREQRAMMDSQRMMRMAMGVIDNFSAGRQMISDD